MKKQNHFSRFRRCVLFVVYFALLACLLTACGASGTAKDGIARGKTGTTMHTVFFDFTVNSAVLAESYGDYTPAEGKTLLVVNLTLQNTYVSDITVYDTDFQLQWGTDADTQAYVYPITYSPGVTAIDGEFPTQFDLAMEETRTGDMVYEIDEANAPFTVAVQELYQDGTVGNKFFVTLKTK